MHTPHLSTRQTAGAAGTVVAIIGSAAAWRWRDTVTKRIVATIPTGVTDYVTAFRADTTDRSLYRRLRSPEAPTAEDAESSDDRDAADGSSVGLAVAGTG